MSPFEDSTTNEWINKPGPINLRQGKRERRPPDVHTFRGILIGAIFGTAFWIWCYVLWIAIR